MPLVALETAKAHLRVDHDEDDAMVSLYLQAAEDAVRECLDRPLYAAAEDIPAEGEEGYDPFALVVTSGIASAILLLVGRLYETREAHDEAEAAQAILPAAVRAQLAPWRVWRQWDESAPSADPALA